MFRYIINDTQLVLLEISFNARSTYVPYVNNLLKMQKQSGTFITAFYQESNAPKSIAESMAYDFPCMHQLYF